MLNFFIHCLTYETLRNSTVFLYTGISEVRLSLVILMICVWSKINEKWIFVCVEDLGRDSKWRMSFYLKISVLFVCRGGYVSLAESWDMQNDMEKCKNGNLFNIQVLVLLFIDER